MNTVHSHKTRRAHPFRKGWTCTVTYRQEVKADGTPDKRYAPRAMRGMVQHHTNGHKRIYFDNALRYEKYVGQKGENFT